MIKGLIGVAIGLVTFIVIQQLVAALVTGTSTGDVIKRIQRIVTYASNCISKMLAKSGKPNLFMGVAYA